MRAIFFSPYADVWVHSLPESEIAEALSVEGWEILRVTCDREYAGHCVAMSAKGVAFTSSSSTKDDVCASCVHRKSLLQRSFNFQEISLGALLGNRDLGEISDLMSQVTQDNWFNFEIGPTPIGRMAFYDFALSYKMVDQIISDELWPAYVNDLTNSVKTYFAIKNLLAEKPSDVLITYNGMYATNNVAASVAREHGTQTWSLHAGHHLVDRFSTMYMYESTTLPVLSYNTAEWIVDKRLSVTSMAASKVTEHILELFKASNRFVYSSPLEKIDTEMLMLKFGIKENRKILLATMSSADEIFGARMAGVLGDGAERPLFDDGFDWIQFLVEQISKRTDLHLIIRVHPREFPNKREKKLSQNAVKLKELLTDLPENISVNWPDDEISLYGLAHIVDVVLNSTSSAGLEMASLGLPVVLHRVEHMLAYDPQLQPRVESKSQYMQFVNNAIETGWSIEYMRQAYRWWGFIFSRVSIDIQEGFSYPAAGYISAEETSKAKLKNRLLTAAVKYGPSIQERLQLARRKNLKNGPLFHHALKNKSKILIAPRTISEMKNITEEEILRREATRLLDVLAKSSATSSKLILNMKNFIEQ
jgi:hypothetical protein